MHRAKELPGQTGIVGPFHQTKQIGQSRANAQQSQQSQNNSVPLFKKENTVAKAYGGDVIAINGFAADLTIRKVIITPECIAGKEPKIIRDPSRPRQRLDMHNS